MKDLIIVRGGGDIATGTIYKLVKSGFHVLILEIAHPSAIRRNVAFSEAVYEEKWQVEDMTCHLAHDIKEAEQIMKAGNPALMIDPNGEMIKQLHPIAVVDAILAKKNLGTTREQRRTNGNFFVSIVIFAINCNSFRHGISVIIYTFVP